MPLSASCISLHIVFKAMNMLKSNKLYAMSLIFLFSGCAPKSNEECREGVMNSAKTEYMAKMMSQDCDAKFPGKKFDSGFFYYDEYYDKWIKVSGSKLSSEDWVNVRSAREEWEKERKYAQEAARIKRQQDEIKARKSAVQAAKEAAAGAAAAAFDAARM